MTNSDNTRVTSQGGAELLLNCHAPRGSRTQISSLCCLGGDALLSFLLIFGLRHSSEALQTPRRTEHQPESLLLQICS